MDATSHPAEPAREQIDLVVDLLEVVYQANGRMAAELDRITASRGSVSDAFIERFLRLAEDLRPGATARAHLATLDNEAQIAGAAEWIARRRQLDPDSDLLPTAHARPVLAIPAREDAADSQTSPSAAARALTRWHGQAVQR